MGTVVYMALMLVGAVTGFLKLFVLGNLLSKAGFGEYSFLNGVVTYGVPVATFGIMEGLSRQFPILLGRGRTDQAYALRNQAISAMGGAAVTAIVVTAAAAYFFERLGGQRVFVVTCVVALEIYAFTAFSIGLRDIRNHLRSVLYGAVMLAKALADLGAAYVVAPRYGFIGILVAETIVLAAGSLVIFVLWMPRFAPVWPGRGVIAPLVREGAVLSVAGVLANTARMADRLILGAVLPATRFADYAFHLLVISAGSIGANVLTQYVGPRSLHLYGQEHGRLRPVAAYLGRMTVLLMAAALLAALFVPFGFHAVAGRFFTRYAVDDVLLLLLYAAAAIDVANLLPLALIAHGKLRAFIAIQAVGSVLLVAACLVGAREGASLALFGAFALASRVLVFIATAIVTVRAVRATDSVAAGVTS